MKKYGITLLSFFLGILIGWQSRALQSEEYISEVILETEQRVTSELELERSKSEISDKGSLDKSSEAADQLIGDKELNIEVRAVDLEVLLLSEIASLEERIELIGPADPLARLLNLTEMEVVELNEHWRSLSKEMRFLQSSNTEVVEVDDGSLILNVNEFPEKGIAAHTEFKESLNQSLGEARGVTLMNSIKGGGAFSKWGQEPASFHIAVIEQVDDSLLYEIKELKPNSSQYTRKWRTAQMPVHLKRLTNALGISPTP